ncbi:MAG TPA: hypothetical protein VMW91_02300 [Desulfosporosinus sp.]|nr:hypothetical protein [Desulfosporosinus sp.]
MTEQLIEEVAKLWIELGGDSEGVTWSWMILRDEVKRLENAE